MRRGTLFLAILLFATAPLSAEPGWQAVLDRKLGETKVTLQFQKSPAHQVVRTLGRLSGVDVTLDVPLREKTISLKAEDEAAEDVLDRLAKSLGARWDLRWGGVFIAEEKRMDLLPDEQPGTFTALDAPVSLEFAGAALPRVLEMLSQQAGVAIAVAPAAKERVAATLVYVYAREASIRDILCRLLYPADLGLALANGKVQVVPAMTKRPATWQEELDLILVTTMVNIDFEDTDFREALGFLARFANVAIHVDPAVFDVKSEQELLITLRADDISVRNTLELITLTKSMAYDLRWGGVFVSTEKRLEKLPMTALPATPAEKQPRWEKKLRADLQTPVSLAFEEAPAEQIVGFMGAMAGVRIYLDPEAAEAGARTPVTVRVDAVALEHALAAALIPHGFRFRLEENAVRVVKPR